MTFNYNPDDVEEPGFPYLGFCPVEVYDPNNHNPDTCQFCQEGAKEMSTQYTKEAHLLWERVVLIAEDAAKAHWRGWPNEQRKRIVRIRRKAYERTMRRYNKFGFWK